MGNFIKKNIFLCIIIALLAGISIFYIYDTNTGKLPGKRSGTEDVVYEINGEDITAEQFYEQMYQNGGEQIVAELFGRTVVDQAIETTPDLEAWAQNQAAAVEQNYKYSYGASYKDVIGQALIEAGYSGYEDLQQYMLDYRKRILLSEQYAEQHFDELKIRSISYLLIMEGENTEDRKAAVDAAFAEGKSFADVAKEFSEDTSTAYSGGVLGVIDANTNNLDEAFLTAALALEEGMTSPWVHSEQFGWFRIRNDASTPETLEETVIQQALAEAGLTEEDRDLITVNPYETLVSQYDASLTGKAILATAEALGTDFGGDDELKAMILDYYGAEEE